jgi:hypothetical protein
MVLVSFDQWTRLYSVTLYIRTAAGKWPKHFKEQKFAKTKAEAWAEAHRMTRKAQGGKSL